MCSHKLTHWTHKPHTILLKPLTQKTIPNEPNTSYNKTTTNNSERWNLPHRNIYNHRALFVWWAVAIVTRNSIVHCMTNTNRRMKKKAHTTASSANNSNGMCNTTRIINKNIKPYYKSTIFQTTIFQYEAIAEGTMKIRSKIQTHPLLCPTLIGGNNGSLTPDWFEWVLRHGCSSLWWLIVIR